MSDTIVLNHGASRAVVTPRGAELLSWRVGTRELLWSADPAWWARTSPILFPVVGWSRRGQIRVDGTSYPMGVHGFAADRLFDVDRPEKDRATFTLRDDPDTRRQFPFPFRLAIEYRLGASALSVRVTVVNPGEGPLPYAVGLHPGFRWPFAGGEAADYEIRFAEPETPQVPEIAPGGLFGARTRPVPLDGNRLRLTPGLFEREALCFLNARSRSVSFVAPSGLSLDVAVEGFPHWALWSKPGAPFLSIEVWTGYGDPETFEGEIFDKPSMRLQPPLSESQHSAMFTLNDGGGPP
jgi:galactose mutarotase-like enzyme